MNKPWVTFLALLIAISVLLYFVLVVLRIVEPDALLGLLGVLVGGALVEASRHLAAEVELRNQLRLAALDKRLEAHQQAYSLWRKLIANTGQGDKTIDTVIECQKWWDDHCIYLDPEARAAFLKAFHSAADHATFVAIHAEASLLHSAMEDVVRAGEVIVKGAALPTIGEIEAKRIDPKASKGDA